jgi:Cytochrome C and Quinol oxidase polypeptide I
MMVFSHHVFMDTPNPAWLQILSQTATFGVVFPSGLTIMTIMMYLFRSRIRWNITSMFMLAGIAGWAFGGFAGTQTGWWGTNVYLHNTIHVYAIHHNYHGDKVLHYAGAAVTGLVGILHLLLVPFFIGFNSSTSIFFVATGIAQLFWTVPLIKGWGNFWYFIGIAGTVLLIVLYLSISFDWKFVIFYIVIGIAQLFWTVPLIKVTAIYLDLRSNSFHLRTAFGTCSFLMVCSTTHAIIF